MSPLRTTCGPSSSIVGGPRDKNRRIMGDGSSSSSEYGRIHRRRGWYYYYLVVYFKVAACVLLSHIHIVGRGRTRMSHVDWRARSLSSVGFRRDKHGQLEDRNRATLQSRGCLAEQRDGGKVWKKIRWNSGSIERARKFRITNGISQDILHEQP